MILGLQVARMTFNSAAAAYTISGNAGVAGATLSYTNDAPQTATADGSGNYSINVPRLYIILLRKGLP